MVTFCFRSEFLSTPVSIKRASSLKTHWPSPGLLGVDVTNVSSSSRRSGKKSKDPWRRRTCQPVIRVAEELKSKNSEHTLIINAEDSQLICDAELSEKTQKRMYKNSI